MKPDIECFFHTPDNTFTYVVSDPESKRAAVIDPVLDFDAASGATGTQSAQDVLEYLAKEGLELEWILETHAHADHLTAAAWLKVQTDARTGIGAGIRDVQATFKDRLNLEPDFPTDGRQFDRLFDDGDTLSLGQLEITVMATPGHTSDSVTYLVGDAAFVGDTLFRPDFGTARCDFPGGDAGTLYESIKRLYALPQETRLFLCHDYPSGGENPRFETTVSEQKQKNVHLRSDTRVDEFVTMRESRDKTLGMPDLIYPSVQVNIRSGGMPPAEGNGKIYLKIPVTAS